ncbi:MAG: hypothetical protein ABI629_20600 [bacterium]
MRLRFTPALLAVLGLAGCAGNGPPPAPPEGWFNTLQAQVFNQHCLSAGCHNSQAVAGGLNLSPGASYDALVNVLSDNTVAQADGLVRAKPFAPTESFLLIKVTAPSAGEGGRMPLGMQALSADDIDLIRNWLIQGAPNATTPGLTVSPTPEAPTATPTPSATASATATATVTPLPPDTATPTVTVTGTAPPTSTASVTPTVSSTPSASPTPTPSETPAVSFALIQTTIFNPSCATQFCHDAETKSGNLDLEADVSYGQFIDVVPDNANARNAGLLRVDPGVPANSFLLTKVQGPTIPLQGGRMPLGQPKLSEAQIKLINDWIAAGAAN